MKSETEIKEISHLLSHLQGAITTLRHRFDHLVRALQPTSSSSSSNDDAWGALSIAADGGGALDEDAVVGVKELLANFVSSRKVYAQDGQGRLTVLLNANAPEVMGAAELVRRRIERMPIRLVTPLVEGVASGTVLQRRTVSIGVATENENPDTEGDPARLVEAATRALEKAKATGETNQVRAA